MGNKVNKRKAIRSSSRENLENRFSSFGFHYTFSEGTKTEPYYLDAVKDRIRSRKVVDDRFSCIKVEKSNNVRSTYQLVQYAEKFIDKVISDGKSVDYVWIFFDKDQYKDSDYNKAFDLIEQLNKDKKYKYVDKFRQEHKVKWTACWSNISFELWLVLNLVDCQSELTEKDLEDLINKYIDTDKYGEYHKQSKKIFEIIEKSNGSITKAIKRAKNLYKLNNINNPSTGVYKFFDHFKLYLGLDSK